MIVEPFKFDTEFQRKVIKLALEDDRFCTQAMKYIEDAHFENDSLQWAWKQIVSERQLGRSPTLLVLRDRVKTVTHVLQPRYHALVTSISEDKIREEAFIRQQLAEFCRRAIFVTAWADSQRLYNTGHVDEAIALMTKESIRASRITFDAPDREWFFESLTDRQRVRQRSALYEFDNTFPTGITTVDYVLDGGLSRGELGVWVADSKGGKSLFLVHLAAFTSRTSRRPVLFIVLEGSRSQVVNRLESLISRVLYRDVKRGNIDPEVYQQLLEEYRELKQLLVVRGMTDAWKYTGADIRAEIDELKSSHGWVPEQLVVDYGDLLRSQESGNLSEEQHQRDAFGDLKTLSAQDNGYSVWTASQSRRPAPIGSDRQKEQKEVVPAACKPVIEPRQIADSYNKVRRADFIGSINQDKEELAKRMARLWCAMYRDNPAGVLCTIKQDLDRMVFADLLDPSNRDIPEGVHGRFAESAKRSQFEGFEE